MERSTASVHVTNKDLIWLIFSYLTRGRRFCLILPSTLFWASVSQTYYIKFKSNLYASHTESYTCDVVKCLHPQNISKLQRLRTEEKVIKIIQPLYQQTIYKPMFTCSLCLDQSNDLLDAFLPNIAGLCRLCWLWRCGLVFQLRDSDRSPVVCFAFATLLNPF